METNDILKRRINKIMKQKGMKQNDLYTDVKDSSKISLLVNGKVKDPRLSTLITVADALDVSLDYLAGRTDNPLGFCDEEIEDIIVDQTSMEILQGINKLNDAGKEAIRQMIGLEAFKSEAGGGDTVSSEAVA